MSRHVVLALHLIALLAAASLLAMAQCDPDTAPPWFDGPTGTGGALSAECTTHVEFTATVYDDCGIDAEDVHFDPSNEGQFTVDLDTIVQEVNQINPTTVEVLMGFDVIGITQGPVSISLYLAATDLNGNSATSTTATVCLTDELPPEITSLTVTPEDGFVGRLGDAQTPYEAVTVEFTVEDNCCIDITDWATALPVTFTALNAFTLEPTLGSTVISYSPGAITVTATYYVYGLTTSPVTPEATVTVKDCYGATATASASGSDIVDDEEPQTYLSDVAIYPEDTPYTDETCECTMVFGAGVQDNCAIDLDSIVVTATSPGAMVSDLAYTVTPTYLPLPDGTTSEVCAAVLIEGSFVVSDLTGCTTTPSVQVDVADRTGNEAHLSGTAISEITRGVPPTCSTITLAPASESLDADCGVNFTYQATLSDPCGMSGDDISVTPLVYNGTYTGHTVSVIQDPSDPHAWNVSGSFRANCDGSYSGNLCSIFAVVTILVQTCYYEDPVAIGMSDTVAISDATRPTVSGFTLTSTDTDFDPAGTLVNYQATIADNCGMNLDVPWLNVSAETVNGDATVSTPTVVTSPSSGTATQVSVSGSFLVSDFEGCDVDVEATILAYDGCGNSVTEAQTIHLADETAPTISEITMTPQDGNWLVDEDCEQAVDFVFTVTDNYCIDPADISLTPSVTNGSVKDLAWSTTPDSGATDHIVVDGSFVVYGLSGCPAEPRLSVWAEDCCSNVAITTQAGPHVQDEASPTFSAFTVTPSDGVVDSNCEEVVNYSVTVSDNCCIDPAEITITPSVTNGSVKGLVVNKLPASGTTTQVVVSGSFTVYGLSGCPAVPSVQVSATDCCGNSATSSQSGGDITDAIAPVISNLQFNTDDTYAVQATGYSVNSSCEAIVYFSATVNDNCCVSPGGVTVTLTLLTGNAALGTPAITKTQKAQGEVLVTGSVLVSDLTGCPAIVQVMVDAIDCCDNNASQMEATTDITDMIEPVINDLQFNIDDTYAVQETDFTVGDCCKTTVFFSANVTDNCCVVPGNVDVTVTLPTANGVLENIVVSRAQNGQGQVDITGSADVRCLTSCPARVEVHIEATDCCGNDAAPATSTTTEGRVYDRTPPAARDDPNGSEDRSGSDGLEVRVDAHGQHRLMVRENTPVRIDVVYNDSDNCSCINHDPCAACSGCDGTLWIFDIVASPKRGTATREDDERPSYGDSTSIRYAPYHGFYGEDDFTYRIVDACGNVSQEATVFIEVVAQTVMEDLYLTTCVDTAVSFDVQATDLWIDPDNPDEIPFVFSVVTPPIHGVVGGDLGDVAYAAPGRTTEEIESATITLVYTPAAGFVGRDALTVRFADPFGGSATAMVDIGVIECAGQPGAPPLFVLEQGEIFPLIVPLTFAVVYETAWKTVTLIAEADGTSLQGTLSSTWEESISRYVLRLDTASLPLGLYQMTIPLGNGETVTLMIEVEAGEAE